MYQWQHTQIFDELNRFGYHIKPFNPLNYSSKEDANEKALVELKKNPYDVFMTCMESGYFFDSFLSEIKRMGIPMILFCPDNLELPFLHKRIIKYFDVIWLTSQETSYLYERWGGRKIVFQTYAANPYLYSPHWGETYRTVGFIGSPYGSRTNKLNILVNGGIDCSVYSNLLFDGYNTSVGGKYEMNILDVCQKAIRYMRFPIGRKVLYSTILNKLNKKSQLNVSASCFHKYRSVTDEEMNHLYSNFALSLNISELRDTYCLRQPIHKIHLRSFEIPMAGGLQFASYTEELGSYFEEDKEIVMYKSKEEMIDKANFYLHKCSDKILLSMKKAARKRAENEHTWKCRFEKVIETL